MADTFYVNFSASATPIEEMEATDTSQKARVVHSSIDKTIGGGKEITAGTTSTDVGQKEYPTTTSDAHMNTISGATLTNIDFMMVKIKESVDSDGDCDAIITIGSQVVSKLVKVGDVVLLRPSGENGSNIKIKSTAGKLSKVDILWSKEV
tara:strand:+ start:7638 stop:8087 length:450 start_codon:yes stop_codon:yes gene_type:complete